VLSVEEAQEHVLARVAALPAERVGALEALGCVLAADVVSDIDVAPFDNSAMDGYAVRAEDVTGATESAPTVLRVVENIPAGVYPAVAVGPGEASRIMTGAPMPEGADAVVMVEVTEKLELDGGAGGTAAIKRPVTQGENVRRRGEDVRLGDTVLRAGEVVRPAAVGLMAAVGAAEVDIHRRPRVAVVSTGDELVDVATKPGPGQIRNSNSFSLAAQIIDAGGIPVVLPIARDNEPDTRAILSRASEFDLMVTTGGVSMGDFDVVKTVLEQIGELDFWRVAMRPGAPQTFGTVGGTPFFGLPGNPTSCMVGFELFVRPAIRKMRGFADIHRPRVEAVLAEDITKKPGRRHFLRGRIEPIAPGAASAAPAHAGEHVCACDVAAPRYSARLSGKQSSAMLTAMHRANVLISLPEDQGAFPAGSVITCIRLDTEEGTP
jgi:molybdopterin molybdotransferase